MSEIVWTGEEYHRRREPFSQEWNEDHRKIRELRERYGFAFWECQKAITNSSGDYAAAYSELRRHWPE
jgi:hypothetical protein